MIHNEQAYTPIYAPMPISKIVGRDWQDENITKICGYIAAECFVLSKTKTYSPQTQTQYTVVFSKVNDQLNDFTFDSIHSYQNEEGYNIPFYHNLPQRRIYVVPCISSNLEEMMTYCQELTDSLRQYLPSIKETKDEIDNFYQICDYPRLTRQK